MAWTKVELPLGGVDQYTDAEHVQPGKLLLAENVRFRRPGGLRKRDGFSATSRLVADTGGAVHATPVRLTQHHGELLLATGRGLHSYSFAADRWNVVGATPKYLADRYRVSRPTPEDAADFQASADTVYCAPVWATVTLYDNGGGSLIGDVVIVDARTGAIINVHALGTTLSVTGPPGPWLLTDGTSIFVVYVTLAGVLTYQAYTPSSASWGAATAITLSVACTPAIMSWEKVHGSAPAEFIVAAKRSADANVHVEVVNASFVSQRTATLTTAAGTPEQAIAVYATAGEDVYVGWDNGTDLRMAILTTATLATTTSDFAAIVATRPDRLAFARRDATSVWFVLDWSSSGVRTVRWGHVTDAAVVTSTPGTHDMALAGVGSSTSAVYMASDPWVDDGGLCVLVLYDAGGGAADGSYMIYGLSDQTALRSSAVLLGVVARTVGPDVDALRGSMGARQVGISTDGLYAIGVSVVQTFKALEDQAYRATHYGVDLLVLDARSAVSVDQRMQSAPWGPSRVFAGAQPMIYDGVRMTDSGMPHRLDLPAADLQPSDGDENGAGGGPTAIKVVLVAEWQNAAGQVDRGSPSAPVALTTLSLTQTNTLTMQVPDLMAGNRFGAPVDVRVGVYTTAVNGDLYYRHETYGFVRPGQATTVTLQISSPRVALGEPLYTDGGVLPNIGAPACKVIVEHRERLFAAGLDGDAEGIAFTKPYKLGIAPEWVADAFVVRIPGAGRITALASLDTALVAFSRTALWVIYGDGPPDTTTAGSDAPGGISGFQVQRITSDVGCANPRSVVVTPRGIMFESEKGIYLLDRGLQSMWGSGAQINAVLGARGPVTGAALRAGKTEVEFALAGSPEENLTKLVYDYHVDHWSVDRLAAGIAQELRTLCEYSGAAAADPWICFASNTTVYRETPGQFADASAFYPMKVQTAPLALDTIGGWERVRSVTVAGKRISSQSIRMRFAYDDAEDYDAVTYDATIGRAAAWVATAGYPIKFHVPRQKVRHLRVALEEVAGTGEGARWSALVFEVAAKRGTVKLAPTART